MARWWRPTGANYFDRVPRAAILEALEEVGGPAFASRYAKAKKTELSQAAERIFAGDFIGEVELKDRALAWVPQAMRFASAPEPAAVGSEGIPPWDEEPTPETADGAEAAEPEAEAQDAETDGGEPFHSVEEAA